VQEDDCQGELEKEEYEWQVRGAIEYGLVAKRVL
jgi:hypothetical protein